MSGFEIAGIVLGALPIILHAVDSLKVSAKAAVRSRIHIEKLSLALVLQQSTLVEIIRSLLISSGFDDVARLDDDPVGCLKDPKARELIEEFLGPEKSLVFTAVLMQADTAVKDIAKNITGLVPGSEYYTDDLLAIVEADKETESKGKNLMRRIKLFFTARELRSTIRDLDETTNALNRFWRLVSLNSQTVEGAPSRKAVKLVKCLRQVRRFADDLYWAMFHSWKHGCHHQHEANMYLDDRIEAAAEILKARNVQGCVPSLYFQLILTANSTADRWPMLQHQAMIRVLRDEPEDAPVHQVSQRRRVTVAVPPRSGRPTTTCVDNICDTIEKAISGNARVALVLAEYGQLATISAAPSDRMLTPYHHADRVSLGDILAAKTAISSKSRMLLALRISSNLLQLLTTHWLRNGDFGDAIFFFTLPPTEVTNNCRFDFDRPFVSVGFGSNKGQWAHPTQIEPTLALLELGIILLELWHQRSLGDQFHYSSPPVDYSERRDLALRWLDDMTHPLPDLYDKAASRCIRGIIGGESRFDDWEDTTFWNAFCVDIIEPLSQNCKSIPTWLK
ncbi:Fc.00g003350.m01.CDS01 [Cosmosporella sp. VM-42]